MPGVIGLAIGTISTSVWPASTLATPSSAVQPAVALRVTPEKRGSTPSLNSSRIFARRGDRCVRGRGGIDEHRVGVRDGEEERKTGDDGRDAAGHARAIER
jgi:hypothetical protein